METVWLVYYKNAAIKNRAFIDSIIDEGTKIGLRIKLVYVEDMDNALLSEIPCAVIVRYINPPLSNRLTSLGVILINNAEVSWFCNNKALTIIKAHEKGISHIPTIAISLNSEEYSFEYIYNPYDMKYNYAIENFTEADLQRICDGELPKYVDAHDYVIKSVCGHGGAEVMLLHDYIKDGSDMGSQETDAFNAYNEKYIIQPLMKEYNSDIRVYVMGNKIYKSVKRVPESGFKSNFSLGGSVSLCNISKEMEDIASNVFSLGYFDYAGIDCMCSDDGHIILNEIEDVVGARMLTACNVNSYVNDYVKHIYKRIYTMEDIV